MSKILENPLMLVSLQAFTDGKLTATINDGIFFYRGCHEVVVYKNISSDIFINAHASYIISLADAAISDNQYDQGLYGFLKRSLELLDQGFDMEVVTNIFELQVLHRFGFL
ncbi:hypothetical protein GCM10017706_26910 [Lactococcus lactis subsp. hordniae]